MSTLDSYTDCERRMHEADGGLRAQVSVGLRELARYIWEHPDLPVPSQVTILYSIPGSDDAAGHAEAKRIAGMLGTFATEENEEATARRGFGTRVTYEACYLDSGRMARFYALNSYQGSVRPEGGAA